jgi:hypothetical protein
MCAPPTTPAPICDREAIVKSSVKALSYFEYRTVDAASTLSAEEILEVKL